MSWGRGQVEKVDFFLGRFLKNSAANRLFRPKNQGVFLQNTVDTAFLEVLTSLELLDLDSMMMAITWPAILSNEKNEKIAIFHFLNMCVKCKC